MSSNVRQMKFIQNRNLVERAIEKWKLSLYLYENANESTLIQVRWKGLSNDHNPFKLIIDGIITSGGCLRLTSSARGGSEILVLIHNRESKLHLLERLVTLRGQCLCRGIGRPLYGSILVERLPHQNICQTVLERRENSDSPGWERYEPVWNRDFNTSGGVATTQLRIPAVPPASNVLSELNSLVLITTE